MYKIKHLTKTNDIKHFEIDILDICRDIFLEKIKLKMNYVRNEAFGSKWSFFKNWKKWLLKK